METTLASSLIEGRREEEDEEEEKRGADRGGLGSIQDLLKYATFVAGCFGCFGNLLSLLVLTRNRLRRSVDPQEHIVYSGLVSITVSDLLFCVTIVPAIVVDQRRVVYSTPLGFEITYNVYGASVLTTFSLLSTWFVVVTAGIRYLGICHPFEARYVVDKRSTCLLFLVVVLSCLCLNLPSFWTVKVGEVSIEGDRRLYVIDLGAFSHESAIGTAFMIVKFVAGVFVPFVLLVFFNFKLVAAVRRSEKFRDAQVPCVSKGETTEDARIAFEMTRSTTRPKFSGREGSETSNRNKTILNVESSRSLIGDPSESRHLVLLPPRSSGGRKRAPKKHPNNRMTIILISMTFLFILLVLPSEVEDFLPKVWSKMDVANDESFHLDGEFPDNFTNSSLNGAGGQEAGGGTVQSREVTNLMHVLMFSCNFLFYTFLSSHFRKALLDMFRGRPKCPHVPCRSS